jgi:hypothetical protein
MAEPTTSWLDKAGELLEDLTSLQVDLIVRNDIRAARMPGDAHALVDLLNEYHDEVDQLRVARGLEGLDSDQRGRVSVEAVQALRTAAKEVSTVLKLQVRELNLHPHPDDPVRAALGVQIQGALRPLRRVEAGCDALTGLLLRNAVPPFERKTADAAVFALPPTDRLEVRKLWELGLEVVWARTVIQLDGDVVTRVLPEVIEQDTEKVLLLQNQGVRTAVGYWRTIIELVRSLIPSAR